MCNLSNKEDVTGGGGLCLGDGEMVCSREGKTRCELVVSLGTSLMGGWRFCLGEGSERYMVIDFEGEPPMLIPAVSPGRQ